nr:MAG TPA: hypothetical protein [Bacteriophage sp.]
MLHFVALVLQVCCIATKLILFYHLFLPVIIYLLWGFCPILGSDKKKRQPEKLPLFENIYLHFSRSNDRL